MADTWERLKRKADQHYEMAGLARTDGDTKDAENHLKKARKYDERAAQCLE